MKEDMKKNIKHILGTIVFLAGAVYLLMTVSYALRPYGGGVSRGRVLGFYEEKKDTIDVVTIGSSSMYRYFNNPYFWENFGITSYNFCTNAQSTRAIEALIDEAEKEQSPQLIVVETRRFVRYRKKEAPAEDPGQMRNMDLRRVTDNIKYSWNRFKLIEKQIEGDWQDRLDYHFDIIRYHGNWEKNAVKSMYYYADNEHRSKKKGWNNLFITEVMPELEKLENAQPIPLEPEAEAELVSLLEKCKKEKTNIVFISTPWIANVEQQRKTLYMKELIESYGFCFYNGNEHWEEMDVDPANDFYNKEHMNPWGSVKFTEHFGQYIMENFELSGDYDEDVIESWNYCVELNDKEVNKYLSSLEEGEVEEE